MKYITQILILFELLLVIISYKINAINLNDHPIIKIPIYFELNQTTIFFQINFSNLSYWRDELINFSFGLPEFVEAEIIQLIENRLKLLELSDFPNNQLTDQITLTEALSYLYYLSPSTFEEVYLPTFNTREYFVNDMLQHSPNLHKFIFYSRDNQMTLNPEYQSLLPSFIRLNSPTRIIIMQTRDAFTGGTTALRVLYNTLSLLKYPVVLCNETNHYIQSCSNPLTTDIVITGEWCNEVYSSFTNNSFNGRGVQYFLGFHHGRDFCRGRIVVADSHYLSSLLGSRLLHAYHLGCPMAENIEVRLEEQINSLLNSSSNFLNLKKENLIIIDYDIFEDYPLAQGLKIRFPAEYKYVLAKDIPAENMPLLLQRAKIVLDLALPGPERISSEGVLFGAIPIVANYWNGASFMDFPFLHKVDPLNNTDIETKLNFVIQQYDNELQKMQQLKAFSSVASFWNRLSSTSDLFFGSSYYRILLKAESYDEEVLMIFQALSLIYLYPMLSLDLYVRDVVWFQRHHYLFIDYLKQSGYLSLDIFDPNDFTLLNSSLNIDPVASHIRIINISQFPIKCFTTIECISAHLIEPSPWKSQIAYFSSGFTFKNPESLFLLTPEAKNTNRIIQFSSQEAFSVFISPSCTFETENCSLEILNSFNVNIIPICQLFFSKDGIEPFGSFVFSVRKTPVWMNLQEFYYQMGFKCDANY